MLQPPLLVTGLTSKDKKVLGEKTKNLAGAPGWVRNKRIDCPFSPGLFICSLCIRSGFDLRYHFCPVGRARDADRNRPLEDLQC